MIAVMGNLHLPTDSGNVSPFPVIEKDARKKMGFVEYCVKIDGRLVMSEEMV